MATQILALASLPRANSQFNLTTKIPRIRPVQTPRRKEDLRTVVIDKAGDSMGLKSLDPLSLLHSLLWDSHSPSLIPPLLWKTTTDF